MPCQNAREQASELMGYARDLSIDGLMEDKPQLLWASHCPGQGPARRC